MKMKEGNSGIIKIIILIFLSLGSYLTAQPGMRTQIKDRVKLESQVLMKELPDIKELDLNKFNDIGEWFAFKNLNEGTAVAAENDSIVWVASSVGLVRWNVITKAFKLFDETNGLKFTSITSLAFDSKSQLWIGTGQGLVKFFEGTFSFYSNLNSGLPEASITDIIIDSNDRIFACIDAYIESNQWKNGGFVIFDESSWKIVNLPIDGWIGPPWSIACYHDTIYVSCDIYNLYIYTQNGLQKAPNWNYGGTASMVTDCNDALWISTSTQELYRFSKGIWSKISTSNLPAYWPKLAPDPRGGLWVMGSNPLYRLSYAGYSLQSANVNEIFLKHTYTSAANQFFISENGLFKFDGIKWTNFTIPLSVLENDIYGLGTGPKGEVYVSSAQYTQKTNGIDWQTLGDIYTGMRSGNNHFRTAPNGTVFTNHHQIYSKNDSYIGFVTGLDFDNYGNLWATYPLTRFKWPSFSSTIFTSSTIGVPESPNNPTAQFMDVMVDKYNNVWAAAWHYGAAMFDSTNWHLFPRSDTTLPNYDYDLVFADSKGRIWFATNQSSPNYGFTLYDGKNWSTYYSPQRYGISYVSQIAEDHFGNIWLATLGGLLKYDGISFTILDKTNSRLNTNSISAVTVDLANNIWIGTSSGLYVYNQNNINLGQYVYSSPIETLSVFQLGMNTIISFTPFSQNSDSVKYELQAARMPFKFWTFAGTNFLTDSRNPLKIIDTSSLTGLLYYRIKRIDAKGYTAYSAPFSVSKIIKPKIPENFYVSENYPNPFNSGTAFIIETPEPGNIELELYDILGRKTGTLIQKDFDAGYQTFQMNLSYLSSGIYFCKIKFKNQILVRKIMFLK